MTLPARVVLQLERGLLTSAVSALCVLVGCEQPLPDLAKSVVDAGRPAFIPTDAASSAPAASDAAVVAPPSTPSTEPTSPPVNRPGSNEPDRDPALTVVHGVADATLLYFCPEGEGGELQPEALPSPRGGLAYAETWVRTADDFDFDAGLSEWIVAVDAPLADDVRCGDLPKLVTSDAESQAPSASGAGVALDAGAVHTELDASWSPSESDAAGVDAAFTDASDAVVPFDSGSPDAASVERDAAGQVNPRAPRVVPFVTFPAGSFERAKSSLLIAGGCIGPVSSAQATYCGTSHAMQSSLQPYWVPLSRTTAFDSVGLQFINASDVPRATLRSSPDEGATGAFFSIGYDVGIGEIGPEALRIGVALVDIGAELSSVQLAIEVGAGSDPVFTQTWQAVVRQARDVELRDGGAFSFILLGAATAPRSRAFNPARLMLISNDPVRDSARAAAE